MEFPDNWPIERPDILALWNHSENNGIKPKSLHAKESIVINWKCAAHGHSFSRLLRNMFTGSASCPYCTNKKVLPGFNDALTINPAMAVYWHPSKNSVQAHEIVASSKKWIWFQCNHGHGFRRRLSRMIERTDIGCPKCRNRPTVEEVVGREALRFWDQQHNEKSASDTRCNKDTKSWWKCTRGHHDYRSVYTVSNAIKSGREWCLYCRNYKTWPGFNDLASQAKAALEFIHPSKNANLDPSQLMYKTIEKIWWRCEEEHEDYLAPRFALTAKGEYRCRICANTMLVVGKNDFATTCPEGAKMWHPTKNGDLSPQDVKQGSRKERWWQCEKGHDFLASPKSIRGSLANPGGRPCPNCGMRELLAGFNDLATTDPEIAALWHPTKNGELTPSSVMRNSPEPVWWTCPKGHSEDVPVIRKVYQNKMNCSMCSRRKIVPNETDLATTHPVLSQEWHPIKNEMATPSQTTYGSKSEAWWLGPCGHEWRVMISGRGVSGSGCPYCSGHKVLAGFNDLATKHPEIAKEWHPTKNGGLTPSEVTAGSNRKAWWLGSCGHRWELEITNRTGPKKQGCTTCAIVSSEKERRLRKWVHENFDQHTEVLGNYKKLRSHGVYDIDIYLPKLKLGIDFNGLYWHSTQSKKDTHYHQKKHQLCLAQGIDLIQIWEDDWEHRRDKVFDYLRQRIRQALGQGSGHDPSVLSIIETSHKLVVNIPRFHCLQQSFLLYLEQQSADKQRQVEIIVDASQPVYIPKTCSIGLSVYVDPATCLVNKKALQCYRKSMLTPRTFQENNNLKYDQTKTIEELIIFNKLITLYDAGQIKYTSNQTA